MFFFFDFFLLEENVDEVTVKIVKSDEHTKKATDDETVDETLDEGITLQIIT